MNILLTNDDGIDAEGIKTLAASLKAKGHNVALCAPMKNQSGKSHSITINKDILSQWRSKTECCIKGTPADTILFFLSCDKFSDFIPDVVISGINYGYNVSSDIQFSGTCAAASVAAMCGLKAIAVSAQDDNKYEAIKKASNFITNNINRLVKKILPNTYLNINVPNTENNEWEIANLSIFSHAFSLTKKEENDDKIVYSSVISDGFDDDSYRLDENSPSKDKDKYKSDCFIVKNGKISISLISVSSYTLPTKLKGISLS